MTAATTLAPLSRRALAAAPLLAFASAAVALLVVGADRSPDPGSGRLTSYAGVSSLAALTDLAAGIGLLVVAAIAFWNPATARSGPLVLAAGLVWFAPDFEGWVGAPSIVRSLGALCLPLFPALLGLLLVPRLPVRLAPLATSAVVVIGSAALVRALVRDPLYDAYCWRTCAGNDLLVRSSPRLAVSMDHVWLSATIALGLVAVIGAAMRRRSLFLAAGAIAACAQSAYAVGLLQSTRESPQRLQFETLFYARALSVLAFAAALLGGMAWTWQRRESIVRLARVLASGPAPGRLQDALGETLGDPTLEVVYWLPRLNGYVDRNGRSVDLRTDEARLVTPIVRNGEPVAAVLHDPAITDSAFERELGAAARLAVENERLHAEVQVQLEALRRSRMRITERGDAERRRLERDLHDGAQQRLLALFYDLRLARSSATGELAAKLDAATEEAQLALEELRDLAHGIYPAILTEAGLGPALASLADDAPLPVELSTGGRRFDASVEAAIYVAAREAIDDAAARGATGLRIVVEEQDEKLSMAIDDDGSPRTTGLLHVHDRIGALGGTVHIGQRTLTAVVPCA